VMENLKRATINQMKVRRAVVNREKDCMAELKVAKKIGLQLKRQKEEIDGEWEKFFEESDENDIFHTFSQPPVKKTRTDPIIQRTDPIPQRTESSATVEEIASPRVPRSSNWR